MNKQLMNNKNNKSFIDKSFVDVRKNNKSFDDYTSKAIHLLINY